MGSRADILSIYPIFAKDYHEVLGQSARQEFRHLAPWWIRECGFISLTIIGKISKCVQDSTFNLSLAKRVNIPYRSSNYDNPSKGIFRHGTQFFQRCFSPVAWMEDLFMCRFVSKRRKPPPLWGSFLFILSKKQTTNHREDKTVFDLKQYCSYSW